MHKIIKELHVPKVILRYIMMIFLDMNTIKNIILHVKIMNVLDNHSKNILDKTRRGFIWNCKKGYLDVAQWMYNLRISFNICTNGKENGENVENAFKLSCANGHLTVAQWLFSLDTTNINIHADNEFAFKKSCEYGHFVVAQWLYDLCEKDQNKIDINDDYYYAYRYSCLNGHLAIAQWLHELRMVRNIQLLDQLDQHALGLAGEIIDQYVFGLACENGHLHIVKWLYSLGTINIRAHKDTAFKKSCEYGHLDVAQWLYYLGRGQHDEINQHDGINQHDNIDIINIHDSDEYAFRWSCIHGHLDVAQWLYSLGQINVCAAHKAVLQYSTETVLDWLNQIVL